VILPDNGYPPPSLGDGPTLRAAGGTALYIGLVALLSTGVATLVRDTAAAVTAVLSLLYVAPMIGMVLTDPAWERRLQRLSPMNAGLAVQATRDVAAQPIGPWRGLGVLAAYAGIALVAGAVAFRYRDA
jgi:ABC-2 type transport system permease protein